MKQYTFNIDYNGKARKVKKHWQFCVGSGHAALAQRADYIEQLKIVHDELGIERVRFHGVFNDDMNVCLKPTDHLPIIPKGKTKIYDFYQVGRIYDNLLRIGVKPFVELSFMPTALASGKKTVFYYKGNVTQPKNMSEWQDFIRAFAKFLMHRYGAEEVRTWYFEVWNEPDLDCFFKGSMKDYYRLYAATVEALKSVDSQLMVGGPANTPNTDPADFLKYCKDNNVPFDFISTHRYATDALGHTMDKERKNKIKKIRTADTSQSITALLQPIFDNNNNFTTKQKNYITNEMQNVRNKIGNIPLYYTEWGISSNCVAAIHDTIKTSSFLVKNLLDSQGVVDGSSYWTFSDIFEELFFFTDPFCGGFGLMTIDGIKKPAFWAFKLLSKLPDTRFDLPITDDDVEIAAFKGDDNSLYIMAYAQNFYDEDKKYDIKINLDNIPSFTSASVERIGKDSGNPVAFWEKMGKPSSLTREEIEDIKQKSAIKAETLDINAIKANSCVDLQLSDNEVALIKII